MDNNALTYHLTKIFSELEIRIAERVLSLLTEKGVELIGTPVGQERLLTDKQLCEHLQISISHFHNFKRTHSGFPSYTIGKNVRYKLSEVLEFAKVQPLKIKK